MPELPGGTVTFVITDIEGSTLLWERDHQAMIGVLRVTPTCRPRFRLSDHWARARTISPVSRPRSWAGSSR
ncbi:MAG: hypothetical protein U0Z70_13300 [Thermomicrobiales bacterium]